MRPIHPGEILREEFLVPVGMSAHALSQATHVPATRANDIVHGKRGITADTVLRLARYFGNSPECWLKQAAYDLRGAEREAATRIERELSPRAEIATVERVRMGRIEQEKLVSYKTGVRLRATLTKTQDPQSPPGGVGTARRFSQLLSVVPGSSCRLISHRKG